MKNGHTKENKHCNVLTLSSIWNDLYTQLFITIYYNECLLTYIIIVISLVNKI